MKTQFQTICPDCKKKLFLSGKKLICRRCGTGYSIVQNIPIFLPLTEKNAMTNQKWNKFYANYSLHITPELIEKETADAQKTIFQIEKYFRPQKNKIFLELGCGLAYYCYEYLKRGMEAKGIDFSLNALKQSQKILGKKNAPSPQLFCANIEEMPFGDNSFDLIYGGGVIEHLKEPRMVLREIYRVLKPGGTVFNTVPLLNLGSLTYRQLWGNIPYYPGLRQIAETVHVKLLKAKHMKFGWEYSFTKSYLKTIHEKCGFRQVVIEKFEVDLEFALIKNKSLRKILSSLAQKSPLFWPMVYTVAVK